MTLLSFPSHSSPSHTSCHCFKEEGRGSWTRTLSFSLPRRVNNLWKIAAHGCSNDCCSHLATGNSNNTTWKTIISHGPNPDPERLNTQDAFHSTSFGSLSHRSPTATKCSVCSDQTWWRHSRCDGFPLALSTHHRALPSRTQNTSSPPS